MDIAGGPRPGAPASIAWATASISTGCCSRSTRRATGAPRSPMARGWTPPELPVSGGDALKLGLKPGPKVGALIDAVERWWIDGDFTADRAACLAELERLAADCGA